MGNVTGTGSEKGLVAGSTSGSTSSQENSQANSQTSNVNNDSSDNINTLAVFLKDRRVQSGLSQKEVATQLKYSTSQFISNWERGISQPPLNTLRKLAEIYKINADEMFQVLLKTTIAQVEIDLKNKFYSKDVSI